METPIVIAPESNNDNTHQAHSIIMDELAARVRWRRFMLSRAASNPYLERPAYL